MISFCNPGYIEPIMWETFGVSSKESPDAIGQFGTGLKYAIAVLLREDRNIYIETGPSTYRFTVEDKVIRGKTFQQVMCNGKPLPFTTELGQNWELWQAYRELYCNALDEGGKLGKWTSIFPGTTIYADLDDIDHNDIFLDYRKAEAVETHKLFTIYRGESYYIYCKGVRVLELRRPSMYTYDFKNLTLTEDRTAKHEFLECRLAISRVLGETEHPQYAKDILYKSQEKYEGLCDVTSVGSSILTEEVKANMYKQVWMQKSIRDTVMDSLGTSYHKTIDLDERQESILADAKAFCENIGLPITYPVFLASTLNGGVLALADMENNRILLSDRVFQQGKKQVVSTLLEEELHLAHGLQDLTYDMQSYLFDMIVTMGEKLTKTYL